MAKYECKICGYIYNEQHAGRAFEDLVECPICNADRDSFFPHEPEEVKVETPVEEIPEESIYGNSFMNDANTAADPFGFGAEPEAPKAEPFGFSAEPEAPKAEPFGFSAEPEAPKAESFGFNAEPEAPADKSEEFVVERRQEFWQSAPTEQPAKNDEDKASAPTWSMGGLGSVERVLDFSDTPTEPEKPVEEKSEYFTENSVIETFYSNSEPVKQETEEPEEETPKLWNAAGGTVHTVIEPEQNEEFSFSGTEPEKAEEAVTEPEKKDVPPIIFDYELATEGPKESDESKRVYSFSTTDDDEPRTSRFSQPIFDENGFVTMPGFDVHRRSDNEDDSFAEENIFAAAEETPVEENIFAAAEEAPVEENAFAAAEETPVEENVFAAVEETPVEENVFAATEETPVEENIFATAEEAHVEENIFAAAEEAPVEENIFAAAEEAPVEENIFAAAEETPVEENIFATVEEAPVEENFFSNAEEVSAAESIFSPFGSSIVEDTPAADGIFATAEEAPVEENIFAAAEEAPVEENIFAAAEEAPAEENIFAAEEAPAEDNIFAAVEETPSEETPVEDSFFTTEDEEPVGEDFFTINENAPIEESIFAMNDAAPADNTFAMNGALDSTQEFAEENPTNAGNEEEIIGSEEFVFNDDIVDEMSDEAKEEAFAKYIFGDFDTTSYSEPVAEATPAEAVEEVIEEAAPVEEAVAEAVEEAVPVEEVIEEAVPAEAVEEVIEEAAPVEAVEEVIEEAAPAEAAEEVIEEAAPVEAVEEVIEEVVPVEAVEEVIEEATPVEAVEEVIEEAVPAEAVEEVIEEAAPVETVEEVIEEATPVEAVEEVIEEAAPVEAVEEVIEEAEPEVVSETNIVPAGPLVEEETVMYSMLKGKTKFSVRYDEQTRNVFENYSLGDETVSNGLEDIILLPAQINPMPLEDDAPVETRTIIGRFTDCPVEVPQPFCSSKLILWGEHIPGVEKSDEDYLNQALILVKGKSGHIPAVSGREELRREVEIARSKSAGTPVGMDLIAGRIEQDLEVCVYAKLDFVILNDVSSKILPYALRRAKNYLSRVNSKIEIIVGVDALKNAQELAKLLAMGADCVLVERGFDLDAIERVTTDLKEISRSTGHGNVHDINMADICTVDMDLASYSDISHV